MRKKMLFLDGLMVPATKIFVESLAPGTLSGRGVFETMRSYDGKIFALDDHLLRMRNGLKSLHIRFNTSPKKLEGHMTYALQSNQLKNARIRVTVWQVNNKPRISIIVLPYESYSVQRYHQGFRAIISDIRRDETLPSSRIKSINYLPLMTALRRAKSKGNDEALLLNSQGYLTEGSRTNIFLVKKGRLFTPHLSCGCLPGITRQKILTIAKALKIQCHESQVLPQDLYAADEAFLTNSLLEVMPLTCAQGKLIGEGHMGQWTAKILFRYQRLVHKSRI